MGQIIKSLSSLCLSVCLSALPRLLFLFDFDEILYSLLEPKSKKELVSGHARKSDGFKGPPVGNHITSPMVTWPMTLRDAERSSLWPQNLWDSTPWKPYKGDGWIEFTTYGKPYRPITSLKANLDLLNRHQPGTHPLLTCKLGLLLDNYKVPWHIFLFKQLHKHTINTL